MDYDKVNNPFITLRNESNDQEFTTDLSRLPPSIDNDPTLSNLKNPTMHCIQTIVQTKQD